MHNDSRIVIQYEFTLQLIMEQKSTWNCILILNILLFPRYNCVLALYKSYAFFFLQVPKCFGPVQTLWARPKNELHLVLLQKILCWHNNWIYWNGIHLLVWHKTFRFCTICKPFFAMAQKIWTSPKSFGTCKRTFICDFRKILVPLWCIKMSVFLLLFGISE